MSRPNTVIRYRLQRATWTVVRDADAPDPRWLGSPEAVAALARELAAGADDGREHFWILLLNTKLQLFLVHEVSVGTDSMTLVHPALVFGPAVREGAHRIVACHNHPSGDPAPSPEDVDMTRRLRAAGELLGVPLLDHVIVGNGTGRTYSFEAEGRLRAGPRRGA